MAAARTPRVGLVSWALMVAGLVVLTAALPATWADRTLLDTDRFTAAVAPVIEEPAVREQVAVELTDAVVARAPLLSPGRELIEDQFARLVATDTFADTWRTAVRTAHEPTMEAVRGEDSGVAFDQTTVRLELGPLVAEIKQRLVADGVPLADQIPDVDASFVLVRSPEVGEAVSVARFVDDWAWWLLAASVLLLLASVLVARARVLGWCGLGVAVSMGVVLAGAALVRERELDELRDDGTSPVIARAVFDALTPPLETAALTVGAAGLVVAAACLLWGVVRGGRSAGR
ncbi:hypothetical protein [Nocardioides campestrisoli]|uniref:hypothetical protein n=1 Tax=Nocardioides campestrisoli TaxID=2736757 RepID=UPI00163D66D1|nr:hypothetical protein [Nocardioides campestrisoli]